MAKKKKNPTTNRKITAFITKSEKPTTKKKNPIETTEAEKEIKSDQNETPQAASMKIFENAIESDTHKPSETKSSLVDTQTPLDRKPKIPPQDRIKKKYWEKNTTPFGDLPYQEEYPRRNRESQKSWHLRILKETGQIVQNMNRGILLNMQYDGDENKAFAKFYDLDDDTIKVWIDTSGHRPYLLHKDPESELANNEDLLDHDGYDGMETVQKIDLLADKRIDVTKVYGITPTDIGGAHGMRDVLEGAWEARIRYHHNYIYDRKLIPGMPYQIKNGNILPIPPKTNPELEVQLLKVFEDAPPEIQEMAKEYLPIFSSPTPSLKRLAYDIEVEEAPGGALPNPTKAVEAIISVSFASTDGLKMVYCLDRNDMNAGKYADDFPEDAQIYFFKEERELLKEVFRVIWQYPIIITFNGDNFDNTYLYHRARKLKLPRSINPIYTRRGGGRVSRFTEFKQGIHIDIYQFFANRSIKGYAFGGVYLRNSLEDIASSLLGEGKVKHEGTLIGNMHLADLIYYNLMDSILTLELTTFNNNVMWNLMMVLLRITRLPLQDMYRLQISAWVRSLLYHVHRDRNYIIPRMSELEQRGQFSRNTDGKFKGAYVITPVPGIHYQVAVLDFSSLYPSIIKTKNLSYETVKCVHEECEDNMLPNTPYWACTKKMGVFAYTVGFLRDVRVKWFKKLANNPKLSPEERDIANVMASALKVFINGSYGVFGSPIFPLYYRPVAEATTAIGRFSIQRTIEKAEKMGIQVLYGDSDSVFLAHPTKEQVENLVRWSTKELNLDLELEKTYQFLALSKRKKNYIGVYEGGDFVDLKGLLAKKHNTPQFIKERFKKVQEILKKIVDDETFTENRDKIIDIIKKTNKLIGKPVQKGGFPIEDYAITVVMKRNLGGYTKTQPQHVKAAKMDYTKKYERGSFVSFVKTRTSEGVKPLSLASLPELDVSKYKEMVQSTFEQVLDALGIDYQEIKGVKKLSSFF